MSMIGGVTRVTLLDGGDADWTAGGLRVARVAWSDGRTALRGAGEWARALLERVWDSDRTRLTDGVVVIALEMSVTYQIAEKWRTVAAWG